MGNTLYLECNSGISGDMTVACLLDLGANYEKLQQVLATVPEQGFRTEIKRVKKFGLDCMDFDVIPEKGLENHDHDMEYLFAHEHNHEHGHDHEHEHDHNHEHGHDHEHEHDHPHDHDHSPGHDHEHDHDHPHEHEHTHPHVHRGLQEVNAILDETKMDDAARERAKKIFDVLAEAEAKAHGTTKQEVHFHEVGAIDSIVDIISVAVCLEDLEITKIIVPKLCEGVGTIRCQHGILPIPVPAVSNILAAYQIPLEITGVKGELITPTGAAIVGALADSFEMPKEMTICRVGMGAGKRAYERPSILRGMLLQEGKADLREADSDFIYKLETGIDDATGEVLGFVMEQLFEAGARDVHYFPIYMKKNRPAYQLNVICDSEKIPVLENIIFTQTSTIGIRRVKMERSILPRRKTEVETVYGTMAAKEVTLPDGSRRMYPEYEDVARICREQGIAILDVLKSI